MSTEDGFDVHGKISILASKGRNVIVNGRFLTRRPTGVDRFAYEVLRAWDSLIRDGDSSAAATRVRIAVPPGAVCETMFDHIPIVPVGNRSGQLWEQLDLPLAVGSDEVLLSLCNTAPAFFRRQVVVVHDAATARVPTAFSRGFRAWYRLLMPLLGRTANGVLTVSDFSRQELEAAFSFPPGKTQVVVEGGEHILRQEVDTGALERFGLADRPYVLAVSSMAAHKNFRLVLDALDLLPDAGFDVAIAGGANARVFGTNGMLASDRVKWLGYVSDAELRTLYASAMCFVFPSIYEGFGIPPLEAMNCGCPVLAAHAASIPEVCGDAALYFDPKSPAQLAKRLTEVSGDAQLRTSLREKGWVQAGRFSWQTAARQVMVACTSVMAGVSP